MSADTPPVALLLARAERRLIPYIDELERRLDAGEDVWNTYLPAVDTLKRLVGPERAPLLTTKQEAEKLGVTPRTLRRWSKRGKVPSERIQLGKRGTGAIRWRA
jgi:MerR-like DNA binding protein